MQKHCAVVRYIVGVVWREPPLKTVPPACLKPKLKAKGKLKLKPQLETATHKKLQCKKTIAMQQKSCNAKKQLQCKTTALSWCVTLWASSGVTPSKTSPTSLPKA